MVMKYIPQPIDECPLCHAKYIEILFEEKNNFAHSHSEWSYLNEYPIRVARCKNCGFGFTAELPPLEFFEKVLYNPPANAPTANEPSIASGKDYIFRGIINLLSKHRASGKLIDLGACNGRFLWHAKNLFSPAIGIENDPVSSAMAARHGIVIQVGEISSVLENTNGANVITLIDVLEHLPNPKSHLSAIYQKLEPNGLLYIKVPRLEGQAWKEQMLEKTGLRKSKMAINYVHINHFSLGSLIRSLDAVGFKVIHKQIARPELYLWQPFSIKKTFSNSARILQYYLARVIFNLTRINLGLNIEVLAQK
jgi:2-polyprenyl-3-methyl-5-hydroxy-6-metoxy-1,4-benzoquinol methylase